MFLLSTLDPFSHATKLAKGSCPDHCGNVSIPYPFGMGADHCYLADWFAVDCNINKSSGSATPHLRISSMEVVDIQLGGTMYLKVQTFKTFSGGVGHMNYTQRGRPFTYSQTKNRFVAVGCNNFASIQSPDDVSVTIGGCMSVCDKTRSVLNASDCNGINCCQTAIPSGLDQEFILDISPIDGRMVGESASAFLVDTEWFKKNFRMPIPVDYMVVEALQWQIDSSLFNSLGLSGNAEGSSTSPTSYHCSNQSAFGNKRSLAFTCSCNPGYEGNPYLPEGCQDVDECADPNLNTCSKRYLSYENGQSTHEKMGCKNTNGSYECYSIKNTRLRIKGVIIGVSTGVGVPFLLISGWGSYKVLKKKKMMKRKEKCFKRNGGLLLKQQLFASEVNVGNPNLFTSKDLEKATDNFNVNRILGQGGHGTVYKAMLSDGKIIAVKKSKAIGEEKIKEFINEVVVLSRINHRNVVKLLGCCLETEVPLLVYEFIPNGTLFQYLHNRNEDFSLKWDMRLRIATEVAGALFYLHSATTSPVYHRDIKSTNILLDEKYRAKIADFGTSRSIAIDQSHLTTQVHGTFGYLDPEYFRTSQFTEKSDVYSFGVVLAELLTGEKAISSKMVQEAKGLASYFTDSMEEDNLFNIIDNRVLEEGEKEEIIAVANLTRRCLNIRGKERPAMKEVATELEAVQVLRKATNLQLPYNVVKAAKTEMYETWDVSTSTMLSTDRIESSSFDA